MKLIRLTIHNMASIGDAIIDFSAKPLADSEVFLISGKTGAGKSTILDCICLALFASAPRFRNTRINGAASDNSANEQINVNDPRQILRRNTGEGFTLLEFRGNNDVNYIARWSVQRARKKINGKLQKKNWTLENTDKKITLTKDAEIQQEIAAAIGLDFNQFCRTVMLAQGEFTRFLNSNDSDKSEILSKITGTDIYSRIGIRIFERFKAEESTLNTLKIKTDGITLLSDEEINEKNLELSAISDTNNTLQKRIRLESELLDCRKQKYTTEREISLLTVKIHKLETEVKSLIVTRDMIAAENTAVEGELTALEAELEKYDNATALLEDAPRLIGNAESILKLRKETETEKNSIILGNKKLEETIFPLKKAALQEITVLSDRIGNTDDAIKKLTSDLLSMDLAGLRKQKEQLISRRIEFQNLAIMIQNYRECVKKHEISKKELQDKKDDLNTTVENKERIKVPLEIAEKKLALYSEAYDKLFASSEKILSSIRGALNEGDTCPVCRQIITKALPSEDDIKSIIGEHKENLDKAAAERNSIRDEIAGLDAKIKSLADYINTLENKLKKDSSVTDSRQKADSKCKELGIDGTEKVTDALIERKVSDTIAMIDRTDKTLRAGEKVENEIHSRNKSLKALWEEYQKKKDSLNKIEIDIQNIKTQETVSRNRINKNCKTADDMAIQIIAEIEGSRYVDFFKQDISVFIERLKYDHGSYSELLKRIVNLRNTMCIRKNDLENLDRIITSIKIKLQGLSEDSISVTVKQGDIHKYATDLLMTISSTTQQIDDAKARLVAITAEYARLLSAAGYDDAIPDDIEANILKLEQQIRDNDIKYGAVNSLLKSNSEQSKKLDSLIKEYEEQNKVLEKWKILYEIFGDSEGKKFRKIAQSYILAELIDAANHYMKNLSDRYRLRIEPGTFVILVEDSWQGYTLRSASTISGGESFLVSLSLALALSDIGSDFSVDILFIDEGFGSLSGDALQMAVSTLRLLHSRSGRKVGIISHVDELRERIPTQINVIREGESTQSMITIS